MKSHRTVLSVATLLLLGCSGNETTTRSDAAASLEPSHQLTKTSAALERINDVRARFIRLAAAAPKAPGSASTPSALAVIGAGVASAFEREGDRLRVVVPAASKRVLRPASVLLPAHADGAAHVEDDTTHVAIDFSLRGAAGADLAIADGLALYAGALGGADIVHRVHGEGTEDFVILEAKPPREEIAYDVDVTRVAGLRLVSNTLEFLDEGGTPRLRVAPPYVVDSKGSTHDARITVEGCAYDTNTAGPWDRPVTPTGARSCTVRITWNGTSYPAVVDPVWSSTGSMATPRYYHSASLLASGKVLIAGGFSGGILSTSELFDGVGSFAATGSMTTSRAYHTATVLPSGKVLIAAGTGSSVTALSTAELFDGVGSFTATGSVPGGRYFHSATMLPSGKVLLAGGTTGSVSLSSAALFDSGTFTSTGSMKVARITHTATLLASGKVLIAGGDGGVSAELFDGAGTFTSTGSMTRTHSKHIAALLSSGKVLIAGDVGPSTAAEVFDGVSTFASVGPMASGHTSATATAINGGSKILIAGGEGSSVAELFDGTGTFVATAPLSKPRYGHTATLLPSDKVLVAGGLYSGLSEVLSTAELYGNSGDSCSVASDCTSGFCSDGVCCKTACTSPCQACNIAGSVGTCSNATGAPPHGSCGTYLCSGTSATCATSCTSDTGCAAGNFCESGSCIAKRANGETCSTGAHECASGFCADGVCCATACTGLCQACNAASKATGADGTCGPVKDGIDPRAGCAAPSCTAGLFTQGVCNGAGSCREKSTSCAPFMCNAAGTACDVKCTTDADCGATSGNYCDAGSCTPKKKRGDACTGNSQCTSGFCADGFCCDNACNGACQACGEPGKEGSCVAVMGLPRTGHPSCVGSGTTCGGTCDGSKAFDCSFPGSATTCGDGCKSGAIAHCDGAGACAAASPCAGNFACADATTCKSTCVADSDCAGGYSCKSGACSPASATCSADGSTSTSAKGDVQACAPYRCTTAGTCGAQCTTTDDCAGGNQCDVTAKQCVPLPPDTESGGCTYAHHDRNLAAVALAGLLAIVGAFRRRSA